MQNFTTEYSHILYEDLRSSEISFLEKHHIGDNEYQDFMKCHISSGISTSPSTSASISVIGNGCT